MKDHFQKLARYNRWANSKLFDSCGTLSAKEYFMNRKAFFNSIHGTLNHLLIGDRLWLGRFEYKESGITDLRQILYPDFAALLSARQEDDQRLIEFIDRLDTADLTSEFSFRTLTGKDVVMELKWLIQHLFNHQTHHRGQVHNMLSQASINPPSIDLYYFIIE